MEYGELTVEMLRSNTNNSDYDAVKIGQHFLEVFPEVCRRKSTSSLYKLQLLKKAFC